MDRMVIKWWLVKWWLRKITMSGKIFVISLIVKLSTEIQINLSQVLPSLYQAQKYKLSIYFVKMETINEGEVFICRRLLQRTRFTSWKSQPRSICNSFLGNQDRPKLIPGGIYLSLAITNLINQLDIDMTLVAVNTQYPVLCGHHQCRMFDVNWHWPWPTSAGGGSRGSVMASLMW